MTKDRSKLYRTEAIVLSRMDFRESDRILTLFTRDDGIVRVIAKGTRKPGSRLGASIDVFSRLRFMLARGRDLDIVTSAELLERPLHLHSDLERLAYASHLAELCLRVAQEGQESEQLYQLLIESVSSLDREERAFFVSRHFELALLTIVGYRLDPFHCVHCSEDLKQQVNYLGNDEGGFLCPTCWGNGRRGHEVSINAQKVIRTIDQRGLTAASTLELDSPLQREVEMLLRAYVRSFLERDLVSMRVLQEIRESSPLFRTS